MESDLGWYIRFKTQFGFGLNERGNKGEGLSRMLLDFEFRRIFSEQQSTHQKEEKLIALVIRV